jgi:hypothetical protein
MELYDFPNRDSWDKRRVWLDRVIDERCIGGYDVSEQAAALTLELQNIFCCGAWHTVIILSVAIVDAHFRDVERPDHKGSTADLVKQIGFKSDFEWLRKKRNKLVHIDVTNPIASLDDYLLKKEALEEEAKKAIEIVFDALFMFPHI